MVKPRITKSEVDDAMTRYREESDTLMTIVRTGLPEGLSRLLVVDEKFAFGYRISKVARGEEAFAGRTDEFLYMCEELFDYGGGRLPSEHRGRPFCEFLVDTILGIEKKPFVMVSTDQKTTDHVTGVTKEERKLKHGRVLKSEHTRFLFYTANEVTAGLSYVSLELILR